MKLIVPDYYQDFQCIAERCKDSCCIGWEIDIDEETLDYYKSVPGEFGKRLKKEIREGEDTSFVLHNNRCAFLNEKNLCDICIELGETALCEICLEYPRFTLEYGNTREKCLGMSCEEAGRLLFDREEPVTYQETIMEEQFSWLEDAQDYEASDEEEYEEEMDEDQIVYMGRARDYTIQILQDRTMSIEERINKCLHFTEDIQEKMNQKVFAEFNRVIDKYRQPSTWKLPSSSESEKFNLYQERMNQYEMLELLDEEWAQVRIRMGECFCDATQYAALHRDLNASYHHRAIDYENLLVYFVFRYGMKAVFDFNYLEKVKFAVVSYLVIRDMDAERYQKDKWFGLEERIDVARIYSKEVEHSEDNLQMLKEAFTFEEVFQTEALIKSL